MKHSRPAIQAIGWICIIFFCAVLLQIAFFQPFFGLMDDYTNLHMMEAIRTQGLWDYAWSYGVRDLNWGMFRPIYPLMVYFIYLPGIMLNPTALYLWNGVWVIAIVSFASWSFARVLRLNFWWVLICTLIWPHFYDLFQHPSLQEKMVILFGGALFWVLGRNESARLSWTSFILLLIFTVLGACSKAQITIYLSMMWWILFLRTLRVPLVEWWKSIVIVGVGLTSIALLMWISSKGGYTGKYSPTNIPKNLSSLYGASLLLLAAVSFAISIWKRNWESLCLGFGVLAFVAMFVGWGYEGYLTSVLTPVFGAIGAMLLASVSNLTLQRVAIAGAVVLGFFVSQYRSFVLFNRLRDVRNIVELSSSFDTMGIRKIIMSCEEGAGSFQGYFQIFRNQKIEVKIGDEGTPLREEWVIADSSMCPRRRLELGQKNCSVENVYTSWIPSKGYNLSKVNCPN